ncbi:MAG TPA: DUF433 domain-containing protein [Gemmataceae bacterium]|jgi:uncharacterized protein (DUF433 family)
MNEERANGYIVRTPGVCGGSPRIDGSRIRVQDVSILYEEAGNTPEQMHEAFPTVTLAQIHAALAYYFDHRDAIHADIAEEKRFAEEFKRQHPESVR